MPLEGPGGEDLALEASEAAEKARDLLARRMRSALWITLCSSALLLAAEISAAAGDEKRSRALAQKFLERWRHAPSSRAEIEVARTLAGTSPVPSG